MKNTATCPWCCDTYHVEQLVDILDDDIPACPRCNFLILMYHLRGIDKTLTPGCLMLSRLNSEFRKIINEEYSKHPRETWDKYLHDFIFDLACREGSVNVSADFLKNLDDFPYLLLPPDQAKKLKIRKGRELSLLVPETSESVKRKVYYSQLFPANFAQKYGYTAGDAVVCFIPAEEA